MTTSGPAIAPTPGPAPAGAVPQRAAGPSATARRSGPRPPAVRRGLRAVAVIGVLVLGYLVISALVSRPSGRGYLDITSPEPGGARALAEILRDHGLRVSATDLAPSVLAPGGGQPGGGDTHDRRTIVVVHPGRLTGTELTALLGRVWRGADVVLVAPGQAVLDALNVGVTEADTQDYSETAGSEPRCALPEATTAGAAAIGAGSGFAHRPGPTDLGDMRVSLCYGDPPDSARLAVLTPARAPDPVGVGRLVLLASGDLLTNRDLDRTGNAALALGLLAHQPDLRWVTPDAGGPDGVGTKSAAELLPGAFWWTCLQILVVLVLLALWRGRRLGPPVPEPLPVVVRAAETVEGRGRLYAAARARGRAADALRAGTRIRLAERLGLAMTSPPPAPPYSPGSPGVAVPPGSAAPLPRRPETSAWPAGYLGLVNVDQGPGPDPVVLVASVSEHTGRSPSEIGPLLYGSGMPPQNAGTLQGDGGTRPAPWPQAGGTSARRRRGGVGGPRGRGRPGADDEALLALAHALDELDRQVGRR